MLRSTRLILTRGSSETHAWSDFAFLFRATSVLALGQRLLRIGYGSSVSLGVAWKAWVSLYSLGTGRALGTPLEWPEAEKKADQVRHWGIKVC